MSNFSHEAEGWITLKRCFRGGNGIGKALFEWSSVHTLRGLRMCPQEGSPRKQQSRGMGALTNAHAHRLAPACPSLLQRVVCCRVSAEHSSQPHWTPRPQNYIPPGCLPHTPRWTISAASGRKHKIFLQRIPKSGSPKGELLLPCPRGQSSCRRLHEHCPYYNLDLCQDQNRELFLLGIMIQRDRLRILGRMSLSPWGLCSNGLTQSSPVLQILRPGTIPSHSYHLPTGVGWRDMASKKTWHFVCSDLPQERKAALHCSSEFVPISTSFTSSFWFIF